MKAILVKEDTKKKLDKMKLIQEEMYNSVVERLIKFYEDHEKK